MTRAIPWLLAAAFLMPSLTLAADLEVAPTPAQPPASQPAPAGGSGLAPPEAACLEWTDACRICQRPAVGGEISCSNVGLACVQQASRCTRR